MKLFSVKSSLSLVLALFVTGGRAETVMLHPSADTSLFAVTPDNNLGANSNIVSGANGSGLVGRALLRFEFAGVIPPNAVIQSVSLTVKVVIVPGGGGVDSFYDLRRLLVSWEEGNGVGNPGSPANPGETTWNNRFHPDIPWTIPGGAISNEFSATVSATQQIQNMGSYTFASTPELVGDVQSWLSTPSNNFGWVLLSESEETAFTSRRFGSREDSEQSSLLVVEFLGARPDIQWVRVLEGEVQFSFLAQRGQAHTVEFLDSLTSTRWITLTNYPEVDAAGPVVVVDPRVLSGQRFYRIVIRGDED